MRIMVVGKGAREHAIGWALKKSSKVNELLFAPGNAGTTAVGTNIPVQVSNLEKDAKILNDEIVNAAKSHKVDLIIIGPEGVLVGGLADALQNIGLKVLGPPRETTKLEGSKSWAKNFMERYKIPTAQARTFTSFKIASEYLKRITFPLVIKADGLAEGKGVAIVSNLEKGVKILNDFMVKEAFGQAGKKVIIEEYLEGEECSVFILMDGARYTMFGTARDYKKSLDGDNGENTGGMGSIAYPDLVLNEDFNRICNAILVPTIKGLKSEGIMYKGFLYIGLMLTKEGPKVLEYNVRLGDPETQVLLPLINEDLAQLFYDAASGSLSESPLNWESKAACGVVIAKEGYPGIYFTGDPVPVFENKENFICFHASTEFQDGTIVNKGGRTLTLVGIGDTINQAKSIVYSELEKADLSGYFCRKDIGGKIYIKAGVS